jgi:hypothetical protein
VLWAVALIVVAVLLPIFPPDQATRPSRARSRAGA